VFLRVRVAHRARQLRNAVCGCQRLLCGRGYVTADRTGSGGSCHDSGGQSPACLSPRRTGFHPRSIRVIFLVYPALKRTLDTDCSWFWSVTLVKCLDSVRIQAMASFFHVVTPLMRHLCHHLSLLIRKNAKQNLHMCLTGKGNGNGKGKAHPRTGHECTKGQWMYSCTRR
jgi:hypothetical protein